MVTLINSKLKRPVRNFRIEVISVSKFSTCRLGEEHRYKIRTDNF